MEEAEMPINNADPYSLEDEETLVKNLIEPKIPEHLQDKNSLLTKDLILANLDVDDYYVLKKYSEVINFFDIFDYEITTLDMVKNKIELDGLTIALMSRAKDGTQLRLLKTNISISRAETEDMSEIPIEQPKSGGFMRFFRR